MDKNNKDILKRLFYTLSIPVVHMLYFILNQPNADAHTITTFVDKIIPFNEWFIIPYVYWYFHIAGLLIIFIFKMDNKQYLKVLGSLILGEIICCVIFYFYPTAINRQVITNDGILNSLVKLIYANDNPGNCFPSLHVLNTVILSYFFFDVSKNKLLRFLTVTFCFLIILSTMFIKQHYFLDAVSAIALGSALYILFKKELWTLFYRNKPNEEINFKSTINQ